MNCIIYARVSSKEQEAEGYSIPSQLKLLKEYAKTEGLKIIKEFVDVETAKQAGRSNFNKMIKFLEDTPSIKTILCEKTDRLYRNFRDYVTIDELDLEIHLVKESEVLNKDSKSHQKFIHGIKVLMAKNYIDNLSEETRKGMLEKAMQGIYPSSDPLGYRNNTKTKLIDVDESRAPIITKMFRLYATGSYSLQMVTDLINEEGLRGSTGKYIYKAHTEKILKNPFYYGDFRWANNLYKGKHQPLITKELFKAVQEAFSAHNRPKATKRQFAFAGLLSCGKCGCAITAEIHKGKYIYYHCTESKGKCGNSYVREEVLADKLGELIKNIHIDDETLGLVKQALLDSHKDEKEYHDKQLTTLNTQYTKLQNRIHQIYIDKLDGHITDEFYKEKVDDWRSEQDGIKSAIARHENADSNYLAHGIHILELSNKAYDLYLRQIPSEKARLLHYLLSNCTIIDGSLCPTYRKPFDLLAKGLNRLNWGLKQDASRVSQPQTIQLLIASYNRKKVRLEVSLDLPFPEPPLKKDPINILQQGIMVKSYMEQNPHETCLSASQKINVHRKRIARLIEIMEKLPKEFIDKYRLCDDPSILHRMAVKPLFQIASHSCPNRISKELAEFEKNLNPINIVR